MKQKSLSIYVVAMSVILIGLSVFAVAGQGDDALEPDIIEPGLPVFPVNNTSENTPPSGGEITIQTDFPALEDEAIERINDLRQQLGGLDCLVTNESLRTSAYNHSKDMHDRGFFSFTNPDGLGPAERAQAAGYGSDAVAEAITAGRDGIRDTPVEALADLRANRANYFNRLVFNGLQEIGVGFFSGDLNFEDYWTITFGANAGVDAVDCDNPNPRAITYLPTDLAASEINTLLPTYTWTHITSVSDGRIVATNYDIEIVEVNAPAGVDPQLIEVPRASSGPVYDASAICANGVCTLRPGSTDYGRPLVEGNTYQLWVRAYSPDGGYVWSAEAFEFTIDSNATETPTETPIVTVTPDVNVPELLTPSGTITDAYGNPNYTWRGVTGATSYELYVFNSAGNAVIYTIFDNARHCNGTNCSAGDLAGMNELYRLYNGTYTAYMRATIGQTPGAWSNAYTFTLQASPPGLPTLNGLTMTGLTDTEISRPSYEWLLDGTAQNASWFNVYIAPSGGSPVLSEWISRTNACGSPNGTACKIQVQTDVTTAAYNVYIASYGPGGYSVGGVSGTAYAGPASFGVTASIPTLPPPGGLTVTTTNGNVSITLPRDGNAAWYEVVTSSNNGSQHRNWYYNDPENCTETTCTIVPQDYYANGSYDLFMRVWGPAVTTLSSNYTQYSFIVSEAAPTVATNLGVEYANSGTPTFTWTAADATSWYNLRVVDVQGGEQFSEWYTAFDLGCTEDDSTCRITPTNMLLRNGNTYNWFVYSLGAAGFSTQGVNGAAQGIAFSVSAGVPASPTAITPTGTGTNNLPSFQWNHIPEASWYQVTVGVGDGGLSAGIIHSEWYNVVDLNCRDNDICEFETTSIDDVYGVYLEPGRYKWFVQAYSPGGTQFSALIPFRIVLPPPTP